MADNGGAVLGQQLGQLLFGRTDPSAYIRGQQAGASVQDSLAAARLARAKAINQEGQNEAITGLGDAATKLGLTGDQSQGYQTLGQAGGGDAVALVKALGLIRGQGYQSDARTAALGGDLNTANANLVGLADKPLELSKLTDGQVYNPLVTPGTVPVITTPLGQADIALKNAQAAKGSFIPDIPNGDGTTSAGFIDPLNRTFSPITLAPGGLGNLGAAVMQQESGGNPNALSPKGAMGLMQLMPETAANPGFGIQPARDGSPQENQRVGTQYLSALMSKYGGNTPLALAAYNAGPGRVDAALQQAGGDPNKAISLLPAETQDYVPAVLNNLGSMGGDSGLGVSVGMGGGSAPDAPSTTMARSPKLAFGQAPAKGGDNVAGKRAADIAGFATQGIALSDDQKRQYMLSGKMPGDDTSGQPLPASSESIAQGIASYRLPVSARFMQTPANQAILARAQAINPSLNMPQYAQNQKFMADLASNGPTSAGGSITAANTALGHLSDLLDDSNKLPQSNKLINSITNTVNEPFDTETGNALKAYNNGVALAAAEIQKMIKSGVATEGETSQMLRNLSPNAPPEQRATAIATLADFMRQKMDVMQSKRDQILGDNSPGTSLFTAKGIQQYKNIMDAAGLSYPDLGEPSTTMGYKNGAKGGKDATPSGGHAVGDIITHGGKQYRVTGGDPNDPDVELVQ